MPWFTLHKFKSPRRLYIPLDGLEEQPSIHILMPRSKAAFMNFVFFTAPGS